MVSVGEASSSKINEIASNRRRLDPRGILIANAVLIPLEDGDRNETLVKMGKSVIAVDFNPLSHTVQFATVTIVDNIVRAMPALTRIAEKLKTEERDILKKLVSSFDNKENLRSHKNDKRAALGGRF